MTEKGWSIPIANFEVGVGFPETLREAAAGLYWNAFERKLDVAIGPRSRGVAVLKRVLNPGRAVAAVSSGELLGLAGFHLGPTSFAEARLEDVISEFGPVGGVLRMIPLALLDRRPQEGELLLDGIAVREDQRGTGIGTRLLREVIELASDNGLHSVCLDVVDTNPRARRLYEREGFVPVRTVRTPYLRRAMGFGASTTMKKRVADNSPHAR